MKNILKLEELCMLAISIYGLWWLEAEWWWYLVLFSGPDVSILAYLINNKTGAVCYNLFHHKGIGVAIFLSGAMSYNWGLLLTGIIIFGHSSMDRLFGYGLKYFEGFKFTHLGVIGKNKKDIS